MDSSQPGSIEYRLNYGIALNEGEKRGATELVLRELLAAAPDHSVALNNLANAVQMQGRSAEAVEIYRQALVTPAGCPSIAFAPLLDNGCVTFG